MKIFREAKGIPEPVDTSLFSTSEKVAESVTFNEDGSYSSTVSGEPESDIWKNIIIMNIMTIQMIRMMEHRNNKNI